MSVVGADYVIAPEQLTALGSVFRDIAVDQNKEVAHVKLNLRKDDETVFGAMEVRMAVDHVVHLEKLSFVDKEAHADVSKAVAEVFHTTHDLLSALLEAQRRAGAAYDASHSAGAEVHAATGHIVFKHHDAALARAVLRIENMVDKTHYSHFIKHTAESLGLHGGLYFSGSVIIVVLEGPGKRIQGYLNLATTTPVDVDGSGHKIKEKHLQVLDEQVIEAGHASSFETPHAMSANDMVKLLQTNYHVPKTVLSHVPHLASHVH